MCLQPEQLQRQQIFCVQWCRANRTVEESICEGIVLPEVMDSLNLDNITPKNLIPPPFVLPCEVRHLQELLPLSDRCRL